MSMELLGGISREIKTILDVGSERQRVIAANIANVNTPGYRAKTLHFDDRLRGLVEVEREGVTPREDGNTVVMETETGELRKNALIYRIFLSALHNQIATTKAAITGRSQ